MSADEANQWAAGLGGVGVVDWIVEAEGAFLGGAGLHSFATGTARYAVGFFDPDRLGRGYGSEVTRLVLAHAFGPLGLREVELRVLDFNERAIRCYRRCGFREVRREPSEVIDGGRQADDIFMTVTAAELC